MKVYDYGKVTITLLGLGIDGEPVIFDLSQPSKREWAAPEPRDPANYSGTITLKLTHTGPSLAYLAELARLAKLEPRLRWKRAYGLYRHAWHIVGPERAAKYARGMSHGPAIARALRLMYGLHADFAPCPGPECSAEDCRP